MCTLDDHIDIKTSGVYDCLKMLLSLCKLSKFRQKNCRGSWDLLMYVHLDAVLAGIWRGLKVSPLARSGAELGLWLFGVLLALANVLINKALYLYDACLMHALSDCSSFKCISETCVMSPKEDQSPVHTTKTGNYVFISASKDYCGPYASSHLQEATYYKQLV